MGLRFAARFGACALAMLLAAAVLAPASRAQPAPEPAAASLAAEKLKLDEIEAASGRESLSDQALADLRRDAAAVRADLRGRAAEIEAERAAVDARLKDLGPPPARDAAAEAPAVAAERDQLSRHKAELGAAASQAAQLAARADRLLDRINDRRRVLFTEKLFERSASMVDESLWLDAARALPDELRGLAVLARAWWGYVRDSGAGRIAAALAILAGLGVAALALRQWWRRLPARAPGDARFGKALAGLRVLAAAALPLPLAIAAVIAVLSAFALLPQTIHDLGSGLLVGVALATLGRGVARGVLAPDEPDRRLAPIDDAAARHLARHLTWAVRTLGAAVFLHAVHRQVVAPLSVTIATSALLALVVAALLVHLLGRLRRPAPAADAGTPAPAARTLGWIAVACIVAALAAGHVGFAAFVAERLVSAVVVFGAAYLVLIFVDALFAEVLIADRPAGRAVAANLGLRPQTVELAGTLLSAVLRLSIAVAAVLLALGPRGVVAVEVFGTLQDTVLGAGLQSLTLSLGAALGAAALLLIGLFATRAVQRWLEARFLPRTALEPGLQHSIAAIVGYVGFIAAVSLALAQLGIDLQKIALVAGALSVGIGFGLQSIVSNFVSGLILLAERPIRVGDSIVVKGEEGWVRRIRVRATEIETFERATVIIPNSELISGVVKNWTHANTMGRIVLKVGVAYHSDADQVRDMLMACAADHPQVVGTPPPRVFLLGFGESALEFELRCVVANVEYALTVKSDLYFAILHRFRAAGIEIPYPRREVRLLGEDGAAAPAQARPA
ncbi:MAG TPA: DUF3772 domain-containing protein [Xanthobacteraceae bacterium]|nr:DUF3772 domain-containing protein [Xanthobacteraceae bacterium]